MKTSKLKATILSILCGLNSITASSHHSSSPHFDSSRQVSIEDATIVEWKFVNPHSYLYFDVTSDDGEVVHWRCESSASTVLRRVGWTKETLRPGQKVSIRGDAARREANVCSLDWIKLEDGTTLSRWENISETFARNGQFARPQPAVQVRPAKLANGQPNISGNWVTLSFGRGSKGGQPGPQGRSQRAPFWGGYQLTPKGLELAQNYDPRFDDPSLDCHPINIITGWNHDIEVNEIIQQDNKIILKYGYVDFVRTIHLDTKEHPDKLVPSTGGHSIGRWQDDVLIVDTVGFKPGVLLSQGGVPHSKNLHVIERFYRNPHNNELMREYQLTDAEMFAGVHEGVDYMQMTDAPYVAYDCLELGGKNNQRSSVD